MQWQNKSEGFSLITAIFVIILMATVAMYILSTTNKMVKQTTDQYQREQSMLLANSFTEYAILAVTANQHQTTNCLNSIDGTFGIYDIDVSISYIGNSDLDASCNTLSNAVVTPRSPLNIIVDVFVSYSELDYPDPANAPRITYHKRSLQKI